MLLAILDELPFLLKRDAGDKIFPSQVLPHLKDTVDESSLKALLAFAKTLLKHPPHSLNAIVASEFGLALILCFFHRAEAYFAADEKSAALKASTTPPAKDPDAAVRAAWRGVAQNIVAAMEVLRDKKSPAANAAPVSAKLDPAHMESAAKHLKRFVEDNEVAAEILEGIQIVFPAKGENNGQSDKSPVELSS